MQLEVTEATAHAVYQWLREVCTTHLLQTPIKLGGPGTIVQIESNEPQARDNLHEGGGDLPNFLCMYSTTVGEAQQHRVGYLALLTPPRHRHLTIWI